MKTKIIRLSRKSAMFLLGLSTGLRRGELLRKDLVPYYVIAKQPGLTVIIIENKVLSTENDENAKSNPDAKNKQTEKYFEWSKIKYHCGIGTFYKTPILIFLAPDFEKEIKCKSEAFIKVS